MSRRARQREGARPWEEPDTQDAGINWEAIQEDIKQRQHTPEFFEQQYLTQPAKEAP